MRYVTCPYCSNTDIQQTAAYWWCLKCGWDKKKKVDPDTGRPVERTPW